MAEPKKVRQCPHCKSKRGFSFDIAIGGTHEYTVSFNGKILSNQRMGTDTMARWGICLDCGKSIDVEQLDTHNL